MGDLHSLALNGKNAELIALIDRGADVSATKADGLWKGFTLLHCAAAKGNAALAQALLARGASTTARNGKGLTPAELAADKGHHALVGLLKGGGGPAAAPYQAPTAGFGGVGGGGGWQPPAARAPARPAPTQTRTDADGFMISDGAPDRRHHAASSVAPSRE